MQIEGRISWPVWVIVLFGAGLMTMGAAIALFHPAMLVSPRDEINAAVHIYAGYLASRNLALAGALVLALGFRAKAALHTLILLTAWIQILDGFLDCFEHRWSVAPGVFVLGILFFLAAASLSGYGFWRRAAWKSSQV